jgi:hypothetical protein
MSQTGTKRSFILFPSAYVLRELQHHCEFGLHRPTEESCKSFPQDPTLLTEAECCSVMMALFAPTVRNPAQGHHKTEHMVSFCRRISTTGCQTIDRMHPNAQGLRSMAITAGKDLHSRCDGLQGCFERDAVIILHKLS